MFQDFGGRFYSLEKQPPGKIRIRRSGCKRSKEKGDVQIHRIQFFLNGSRPSIGYVFNRQLKRFHGSFVLLLLHSIPCCYREEAIKFFREEEDQSISNAMQYFIGGISYRLRMILDLYLHLSRKFDKIPGEKCMFSVGYDDMADVSDVPHESIR